MTLAPPVTKPLPARKVEPARPKSVVDAHPVEVGDANDPLEHEADAIADRVMRMPSTASVADTPQARLDGATLVLRRACCSNCDHEDDDELRREPAAGQRGGFASESFTQRVRARMAVGGAPLVDDARAFLEPRLGVGLDDVRMHTDGDAGSLAQTVHARAFTLGRHIFFGHGEHRPREREGMRLLTHEVAHTLQGPQSLARRTSSPGQPSAQARSLHDQLTLPVRPVDDPEEREATAFARTPTRAALAKTKSGSLQAQQPRLPTELSGPSSPLPDALRQPLRAAGADADSIRIHTDPAAARLAERRGARALAFGRHIGFASGEYRETTAEGQRLLLHEVYHALHDSATLSLDRKTALANTLQAGDINPSDLNELGLKDLIWLREKICEATVPADLRRQLHEHVIEDLNRKIYEKSANDAELLAQRLWDFDCIDHNRKKLRSTLLADVRKGHDISRSTAGLSARDARILLREIEELPPSQATKDAIRFLRERLNMVPDDVSLTGVAISANAALLLGYRSGPLRKLRTNLDNYERKSRQLASLRDWRDEGPAQDWIADFESNALYIEMLESHVGAIREQLTTPIAPEEKSRLLSMLNQLEGTLESARQTQVRIEQALNTPPSEETLRRRGHGMVLEMRDQARFEYEQAQHAYDVARESGDRAERKKQRTKRDALRLALARLENDVTTIYSREFAEYKRTERKIERREESLLETGQQTRRTIDEVGLAATKALEVKKFNADKICKAAEKNADLAQSKVTAFQAELNIQDGVSLSEGKAELLHRWSTLDSEKRQLKFEIESYQIEADKPSTGGKQKKTIQSKIKSRTKSIAAKDREIRAIQRYIKTLETLNAEHDLALENYKSAKTGVSIFKEIELDIDKHGFSPLVDPDACTKPLELDIVNLVVARHQLSSPCGATLRGKQIARDGTNSIIASDQKLRIVAEVDKNYFGIAYGGSAKASRRYAIQAIEILNPRLNTTQRIIAQAALSHLSTEGGVTSINTWDGQQLTIAGRTEKFGSVSKLIDAAIKFIPSFASASQSKDRSSGKTDDAPPIESAMGGLMKAKELVKEIAGSGKTSERFNVEAIGLLVQILETPAVQLLMSASFINSSIFAFFDKPHTKIFDDADAKVDEEILDNSASPGIVSVALHNYLGSTGNKVIPALAAVNRTFPTNPGSTDDDVDYAVQLSRQVAMLIREREMKSLGTPRKPDHFKKWTQKVTDFNTYYELEERSLRFQDSGGEDVMPAWGDSSKRKMGLKLLDERPSTPSLEVLGDGDKVLGYADLGAELALTKQGQPIQKVDSGEEPKPPDESDAEVD